MILKILMWTILIGGALITLAIVSWEIYHHMDEKAKRAKINRMLTAARLPFTNYNENTPEIVELYGNIHELKGGDK